MRKDEMHCTVALLMSLAACTEETRLRRATHLVESSWNVMAHGDTWKGKWRGNWRMEWIASTLHTTSEHGVSSVTTADAHNSAASSRLNWRPCRFKWTRPFRRKTNLVSARVPSHFNWPLSVLTICIIPAIQTWYKHLFTYSYLSWLSGDFETLMLETQTNICIILTWNDLKNKMVKTWNC